MKKYIFENELLIKEWDYEANIDIDPHNLTYGSNKKVWWICSKCGFRWQAKINNRAILNRGCPCCSNKTVVIGKNDLATTHPLIAKEWHPTKNGDLTPQKVTYGYGKKVWWLCPNGHEYQATVNKRTSGLGTNCPICNSGRQTSFAEQAIYYYVKKLFPDAISRYTADFLGRMELDIYIPSIHYAIEYDGEFWHKNNKIEREQIKYKLCKENNIKLIRLREKLSDPFFIIADNEYNIKNLYKPENLEIAIIELIKRFESLFKPKSIKSFGTISVDINISRDKFEIQKYCQPIKKDSFADKFPDIAKEWYSDRNGYLKPNMVKAGSDKKVWWICPICKNEYEASLSHRSTGTGCPLCGREKVLSKTRKPVKMIDPKTKEIIKTFLSISDASRALNINSSNISMVCKGYRPKAGGYIWKYSDNN